MIAALIGSSINNRDKGGQIVKQEKPAMQPFVTEVETVKRGSVSKPSVALLPSAPSVEDAGIKSRPKGILPKAKLIGRKIQTLKNIFRSRLNFVRRDSEIKRRDAEKENRGKRENLLEKLNLGSIKSAIAPITKPFTSFFDEVLNAVGLIVMGIIGQLAIENPEAFTGVIKVLERALDTIANIFIGTIDLFSSIINGIDKIEQGFQNFITGTFGEDAFKGLTDLGGNLTQLFDASILLAGLLLQYTLQELAQPDTDSGGKPGKPGKPVPGTRPGASLTSKERLSLQKYLDRNPSTRLIQRQYGTSAANIYQNALDNGKNPRAANAAVQRAIKRGQIKPSPQSGSLRGGIAGSNILKGNIGKSANRLGIKLFGKAGLATAKGVFGRIPVLGPILVAVASIMAGEPVGQTLFKTAGAAIGGLLGSFIPIPILGTMLGEFIGTFVGDLFYELLLGGGPKKAGQKLQQAISNAFATGSKVFDWLKLGFGRFFKGIPKVSFPDNIFIKNFPLKFVRDLAGKKFPNPLWLINPLNIMDKLKLLKNSFFPKGAKPSGSYTGMDMYDVPGADRSAESLSSGEARPETIKDFSGSIPQALSGSNEQKWKAFYAMGVKAGAKYPSLVAAQFALESGWGSRLAAKNNFFGIKATGNESGTVSSTQEVYGGMTVNTAAKFKNFASPQDAVNHLVAQWYKDYKGYKGVNRAPNVFAAADHLKKEGYATDPSYPQKLKKLVQSYAKVTGTEQDIAGLKFAAASPSSQTSKKNVTEPPYQPLQTNAPTSSPSQAQIAPSSPSTPTSSATSTISQPAPYDEKGKINPLLLPLPAPPTRVGMPGMPGAGVGGQGMSNSWILNYYYIQQISAFLYKQG
jgi:hypothetical protein